MAGAKCNNCGRTGWTPARVEENMYGWRGFSSAQACVFCGHRLTLPDGPTGDRQIGVNAEEGASFPVEPSFPMYCRLLPAINKWVIEAIRETGEESPIKMTEMGHFSVGDWDVEHRGDHFSVVKHGGKEVQVSTSEHYGVEYRRQAIFSIA